LISFPPYLDNFKGCSVAFSLYKAYIILILYHFDKFGVQHLILVLGMLLTNPNRFNFYQSFPNDNATTTCIFSK